MVEQQVITTPCFLPEATKMILHRAIVMLGAQNDADVGDQVKVDKLGTTIDPDDGWPLQRWSLTFIKAN
jgi:hypothetical protein